MLKLTHFRLCPLSRSIRLALAERDQEPELVEEHAWEYRPAFLALNPSGELPVLETGDALVLCGAYAIMEYLAEEASSEAPAPRELPLLPAGREERAEVRRLVDWFHGKLHREVTRELLIEKVQPRLTTSATRTLASALPAAPNPAVMRALRANLRYHLSYVGFLADQRRWLAGDAPSFADLAAAAHLSVIDYLGEIPWESHGTAKDWYQRVKSRPSFRPLLADRVRGLAPPAHYADLDF